MHDSLSQQLESVLRMHLPKVEPDQPLPMDVPLVELGLDSLRAVSLVLDLEDTFEIEFPDDILSEATFSTGESLYGALRALLAASEGVDAP
jgi:acyl carrier protein